MMRCARGRFRTQRWTFNFCGTNRHRTREELQEEWEEAETENEGEVAEEGVAIAISRSQQVQAVDTATIDDRRSVQRGLIEADLKLVATVPARQEPLPQELSALTRPEKCKISSRH